MALSAVNTTTLTGQYQKYFSKDLLKYAINVLRLNEFGQQAELPKGMGAKNVSWFRWGAGAGSNVQSLNDGTTITTSRTLAITEVASTLSQLGEVIQLSDILTSTELYKSMQQASRTLGEDAALKCDTVIQTAVVGASGATERFGQGQTSFTNLSNAGNGAGYMDAQDILDAATNLKANLTPRINGGFVAIVPPQVTRDLFRDPDWLDAAKYSNDAALYQGELGSLYGVRVVEATNPWIEMAGTQYTNNASGAIYSTIITGESGFGVVKLSGDSPMSPSMFIVDTPDSANPLLQFKSIGYKLWYAAKLLNGNFVVALRTRTRYA